VAVLRTLLAPLPTTLVRLFATLEGALPRAEVADWRTCGFVSVYQQ